MEDQKRHGCERSASDKGPEAPLSEWAVAALGLVLVVGSVGFTIYEAFAGDKTPPDIAVTAEAVLAQPNGYLVEFLAVNNGARTAASVIVEGRLERSGRTIAVSSTTIDYLPSNSERRGGLYFQNDPRELDFSLRALGYVRP